MPSNKAGRPRVGGHPISVTLTNEQRIWLEAGIPPGGTLTQVVRNAIETARRHNATDYANWLRSQIKAAKENNDYYRARNKTKEGELPENYADDDWSLLFASEATLATLKGCLACYLTGS